MYSSAMIPKLIIRNLLFTPLSTLLSLILLLFGVGIISVLLMVHEQLEQRFTGSLANIDMVVGAKGSPLQLVLSAVYHADAPTGNIRMTEVKKLLHNPMIEKGIPLAYGDTYQGFSITGSDSSYINLYNGKLRKGRLFHQKMEAVLGSNVALTSKLDIDSTFAGTHGREGHVHNEHLYIVTGILQPTGTVLDDLVITDIATVRAIHEHGHEQSAVHGDADDKEHDHEHAGIQEQIFVKTEKHVHDHNSHEKDNTDEITALLLKFRTPMGMMVFPRLVNETTQLQAVSPTLEINRLMNLVGIGVVVLQYVAAAIIAMAALSVFVALLNRLKDRKYEMAVMSSFGYSRWQLFLMVLSEGLLLALIGFLGGILLSRMGLFLLNRYTFDEYHISWQLWHFSLGEVWLLLGVLLVGVIAALLPAIAVFKIDISKTLSNE